MEIILKRAELQLSLSKRNIHRAIFRFKLFEGSRLALGKGRWLRKIKSRWTQKTLVFILLDI